MEQSLYIIIILLQLYIKLQKFTMAKVFLNWLITSVGSTVTSVPAHDFSQAISGIQIEYLPPYSPDLNLIKEAFSKIKHFLCHHHNYYSATQDDGILYDMLEVLDIIMPEDAIGYFVHVGYF
jgi:hypothetical protein